MKRNGNTGARLDTHGAPSPGSHPGRNYGKAECFPTLTLEQVYGAITHYLAHRDEVDAYLQQAHAAFESLREATHKADPAFAAELSQARRQMKTTRS